MFNKLLVVNQEIEMMFRDDYKSKKEDLQVS